jgi:hypothetical protein
MPTEKKDLGQILDQPFPAFLELLDTKPEAAIAEFERSARPWLTANPTPSMRALTAAEQQDVIDETINRCKAKNGEPLRNYSDMWGSFGKWLASVAESTCGTKFRKRAPRPDAQAREAGRTAPPVGESADVLPGTGATPPKEKPAPAVSPPKSEAPATNRPAPSLNTVFAWFRSPRVLIPIAILSVIVAFRAIQSTRDSSRGAEGTTGPIDIVLMGERESRNAQYDVLELDNIPATAVSEGRIPMTAVFRSGRLSVLRISTAELPENSLPSRLVVLNKAGEIAWDSPIDPESFADGSLNLRIDPHTIVPDEYTVRVHDAADAVILRSAFTIVTQ